MRRLQEFSVRGVKQRALSAAQDLRVDTGHMNTLHVWNVTPAFQHRVLNSIHLCYSVATRSLAAFTVHTFLLHCAGFLFRRKPSEVIYTDSGN